MPEKTCPHCGAVLDAHQEVYWTHHRPVKGDYSVCIYCAHILVFTDHDRLRLPTEDDEVDEETGRRLHRARQLILDYRATHSRR